VDACNIPYSPARLDVRTSRGATRFRTPFTTFSKKLGERLKTGSGCLGACFAGPSKINPFFF